ncbi:MAG: HD domain-containing protein [Planctomycetota bacterium]
MNSLSDIPEIRGLDQRRQLIRIPPELDVPLTPRVQKIIDTAAFRRLARISQLGLVSLVYPAAHHTRFEHSLGVYRLALIYLKQLSTDPRFRLMVAPRDAELLIVSALLHDIGHWPFCHPIEDMRLPGLVAHEALAESFLVGEQLAAVLREDWGIDPLEVVELLARPPRDARQRLLKSILSGPIDIDKMDYLTRDSLHAGVPYGRNFDQQRLIGSLWLNEAADGVAILDKGRTAAELMVFARYVMFSEVYWHHAVRAATAMLQRAFFELRDQLDPAITFPCTEAPWIEHLRATAAGKPLEELVSGLFGDQRRLYKTWTEYSYFQRPDLYERLARRPYIWLVGCAQRLAQRLSERWIPGMQPHEIIIDAPPVKREVEFNVEVYFAKENRYRSFGEVSPVIQTLAQRQFDDYVKRVRVFVPPHRLDACRQIDCLPELLGECLEC